MTEVIIFDPLGELQRLVSEIQSTLKEVKTDVQSSHTENG